MTSTVLKNFTIIVRNLRDATISPTILITRTSSPYLPKTQAPDDGVGKKRPTLKKRHKKSGEQWVIVSLKGDLYSQGFAAMM